MSTATRRPFNPRALTSMLVTGGFLVMTVTGLALFTIPAGRVANWVDWRMLGLTKDQWSAVHITSSLLFVGAGVVHLWYNWRQFVAFLRDRLPKGVKPRPEGPVAAVLLLALVSGSLYGVPPFTWVLDLSGGIKESWSVDPAMEPPFGHAEEVTLKTLAARTALDAGAMIGALKEAGLTVSGPQQTVRQVADANGLSPAGVWLEVQKRLPAAKPDTAAGAAWTPESVEQRFAGSGIGNMTVEQAAVPMGLSTDETLARLSALGVKAAKTDRVKTLAEGLKTSGTELVKAILVPGYKPAS
jgi:hypothetical protein